MKTHTSTERNLQLIFLYALVTNAFFMIPVLLPFYQDHIGIGYQGLLIGESAFAASCIIFDVPTSWISDVWRRKHSLALGSVFILFAEGLLLFASNLWHIIICQALWGIGLSLLNGTMAAMLYDSLLCLQRQDEYRKLEGKRQAFSLYGIAIAGPIGGLVYSANNFMPIYLGMGAQVVGLLLVLAMHEPERHMQQDRKHPVRDILKTIQFVAKGHADLGIVILAGAALFSSTKLIMWSQQPYFGALQFPKQAYGILMAVGWLVGGLSSQWGHHLDGKVGIFRTLAVAYAIAIAVCLGAGAAPSYLGVALLMVGGSCIYGAVSPRVNEAINKCVGSERRATALSTQTMAGSSLFIPISSIAGWVADSISIQEALFFVAACLSVEGIGLVILRSRIKPQNA